MARDTTATDRLGLDRPELLDDWASSWDELVELIDEDLVQSGQTADRPDTGEYDEQLYLDLEAQALYYWDDDASSWETAIDPDISDHADDSDAHHNDITWLDGGSSVGTGQYTINAGPGLTVSADTLSSVDLESTVTQYTDADAIAAIEAESPLDLTSPVNIGDPSTGAITYPFAVEAGTAGDENIAIAIQGDGSATNHGNLNWYHSNGNLVGTISGDGNGDHLSIYVADVADVSNDSGGQKKMMDWHCGPGGTRVDFPNLSQMKLWEQTGENPIQLDLHASDGENAFLRWFNSTGTSPGSGTLSYGLWEDGTGDMQFYDYTESQYLFEYVGNGLRIPAGVEDGDGDVMLDEVVAQGTVQLSEGSATVSTGVTTTGTNLNVHLDPSGDGANSTTVGASARAVWNNSAGEYEIEILEDGTDVGNPTIGYKVVTS